MRILLHSKSSIVADIPDFQRESETVIADADLSAEEAGRLCYLSGHRPNPKTATNGNYLLNICNERHYSVLGHASASFYLDGISRNCTHEIIRHRWFTFSEVSQRYVDASSFEFVGHPGLDSDQHTTEMLDYGWDAAQHTYKTLAMHLEGSGRSRKEARQAARQVLPGGTETKILMSGNIRAWRDFLAQRLAPGADLEIQGVAREIYRTLKGEFPNSFQDFDIHGLITVERLVQRALDRYDIAEHFSHEPKVLRRRAFADDVREILAKGLWVLQTDPWEEEKIA